jgi:nicotinamide-nucleotide amidase
MKIGIMTIGDDLTTGRIQDANSSYIAQIINNEGWQIAAMLSVGDDVDRIRQGLEFLASHADTVLITGGLGPTADDMTTQAVADIFGLPLYTDESVLNGIKERFAKLGIDWTENNAKQAMFPRGAEVVPNSAGSAPGFALRHEGKLFAVMPGVPAEVRRMLPEGILPLLRKEWKGTKRIVLNRTIKLFGISESKIDQTVSSLGVDLPGISIGFYPRYPENLLVIRSHGEDEKEVLEKLKHTEEKITTALRSYIFGFDEDTFEGLAAALMIEKGLTLSVAESLTGGLITDRLTNVPGSSAFLNRGIVAYSNECKKDLLGVPAQILDTYGAVSEETAKLMAEGVRKLGGTALGLATTGIAGPAGGSAIKPVGTVYIAVCDKKHTICHHFAFKWDRRRIKEISAQHALNMLRKFILGELS